MKLRNKKTGEIVKVCGTIESSDSVEFFTYLTLSKINEMYEDVKTKEPRIKDEKIRKLVRDWAEVFGVTKVYITGIGDGKEYLELYAQDNGVVDGRIRISIKTQDGIWIGKEYTIEELCGRE